MKTTLSILSTLALAGFASAQQSQVKLPAPSPAASVSRTIGNTQITIEYSSPSVKGRTIWGELVPYGQLWRMGANHCTTIKLSDSAKIGGKSIDAGTYSLFAIPTKEAWTLIINKKADLAGTDGYSEKEDLVRFQVKPEESPMAECLGFGIKGDGAATGTLVMYWEKLKVTAPIEVDVMAQIKTALEGAANDATAYRNAANFLFVNKLDQAQALAWVDKSIQMKETPGNLLLKAQILQKAGKAVDAAGFADKAIANAKADPKMNKEFLEYLEKMAAEIKGKPKS